MRIGLINHYAVPPSAAGGTRHWDLANAWDAGGHTVRILASSFNHFEQSTTSQMARRTEIGRRSVLLALDARPYEGNGIGRAVGMLSFALRVLRSRRELGDVDVVVGSSPHPFSALSAAFVARRRKVPFVYEIRDLWPQTLVDMGAMRRDSVAAKFLYAVERWTVRAADGVVFLPPQADRYMAERGLSARRALHAPNSAPPFEPPDGSPGQRAGEVLEQVDAWRRDGRRVFCYAGTVGRANGLRAVVDAFKKPEVSGSAALVVCGDGPEREALEALALPSENIKFVGHVPKSDAFRIVDGVDVALFHLLDAPVFQYGLSPNKLVDYLNIGKPILYAGPAVPNPATGSNASFDALPGEATSIAAAVERFVALGDDELAGMASAARGHASRNFSTKMVAETYVKFMESLVCDLKDQTVRGSRGTVAARATTTGEGVQK
ncbi:glycosyltransferase family 4 protein [Terrabacter ginsenosidimutans]|uniref:D-inositol 3-phosphate glycosyltransferase n=1 Tax=Terrabacter ginsenosidimutans TaxID=490575 RepID=A0ABP7DYM8_9MICO